MRVSYGPKRSARKCNLAGGLTKREVKGVNARIEEFDLEGSVYDWTFLPDELIEPGLPTLADAVNVAAFLFT
jgi:hypothetical protein